MVFYCDKIVFIRDSILFVIQIIIFFFLLYLSIWFLPYVLIWSYIYIRHLKFIYKIENESIYIFTLLGFKKKYFSDIKNIECKSSHFGQIVVGVLFWYYDKGKLKKVDFPHSRFGSNKNIIDSLNYLNGKIDIDVDSFKKYNIEYLSGTFKAKK